MSPRKLTDTTKKEILKLYRETEATTSTLAERYEVSSSTISRFLKGYLSEAEYEELIQQKRLARTPRRTEEEAVAIPKVDQRQRVKVSPVLKKEISIPLLSEEEPLLYEEEEDEDDEVPVNVSVLEEMLGEDLSGLDEDEDEDDLEDEDEDWDDDDELEVRYSQPLTRTSQLQVLPLSAALLPKICYLVIDRSAELITRPLKDFADLGKIPLNEVQQRTLPIFDSHRVARRFSKRRERVIKVPDGKMIQKAHSYLEAKGITRLLIDGRIYSF